MIRFFRHILIIALFVTVGTTATKAQGGFVEIDTTFSKKVTVRPTEHLLGVRYSYDITGVHFAPDLKAEQVHTYKNYSILYTYYHNLWDVWSFFGIQFGAKYCQYGFTSYYNIDNMDQTLTAIEVPLVTQLKYDVGKHLRLMLDIGGFAGYRLSTDNPKGFDQFDQRWDYGAQGGGGVALKFHPFEIHFEVLYQYSFAFLYHPEKLSTDWWLYSYPNRLSFNVGLHFNFD